MQKKQTVKVKFCHLITPAEVSMAQSLDVDYLGFHLFSFHDLAIELTNLQLLVPQCELQKRVLLTDLSLEKVIGILSELEVCAIQLHTSWSKGDVKQFRTLFPYINLIRALTTKDVDVEKIHELNYYQGLLLDTKLYGGTGIENDWNKCKEIVEATTLPVIIAGGLTPTNVREIIKMVKPAGVDVQTGITSVFDGIKTKDFSKMKDFLKHVRGY